MAKKMLTPYERIQNAIQLLEDAKHECIKLQNDGIAEEYSLDITTIDPLIENLEDLINSL